MNTFDTANGYSNGGSEEVLRRAIKHHSLPRDEIVVMTKVFLPVSKNVNDNLYPGPDLDAKGYANQYILGCLTIKKLRDDVAREAGGYRAIHVQLTEELTEEEIKYLEEPYQPKAVVRDRRLFTTASRIVKEK
ncbi:hypothetical protein C8R47DRAFT_1219062 [Mycena vitilis]|nr:hypothetical protein C8R47DRAFT_1219062 [Mycena vitilis]